VSISGSRAAGTGMVAPMNGELVVVDDVPGEFAERVIECYHARPNDGYSIALSGGETARRCYERLAEDAATQIDWWKVDVYWGDERCVPPDHPESNYRLAREALLDRVGAANATYPMRCDDGADPYQLRLGELGRVDLLHLGLGPDGHTASLFAESPALDADPGRLVAMTEDPLGNNPYPRMTLTYAGISRARLVLVTVEGEEKREALARVARGDDVPAARIHADRIVWLADPAAAGDLA
jgi:6-phosphogluconolactonase